MLHSVTDRAKLPLSSTRHTCYPFLAGRRATRQNGSPYRNANMWVPTFLLAHSPVRESRISALCNVCAIPCLSSNNYRTANETFFFSHSATPSSTRQLENASDGAARGLCLTLCACDRNSTILLFHYGCVTVLTFLV